MKTFNLVGQAVYFAVICFLSTLLQSAFAAEVPDKQCAAGMMPSFAEYAVSPTKELTRPKLKLNNDFSRRFKTRLSNGLQGNPVDFAGHYVLVTIGCGTGCLYGGYIDAATGQATELSFSVSPAGLFREGEPIARRADSRLLIITGNLNDEGDLPMRYFFELKESKLEPICYAPLDSSHFTEIHK